VDVNDGQISAPSGRGPQSVADAGGGAADGGPIGLAGATGGLADACLVRTAIDVPAHDGELVFGFVMEGHGELDCEGAHQLGPTDAFVIPPDRPWRLRNVSDDFQLLHVTTANLD